MRTVVIKDCEGIAVPNAIAFDIAQMDVKNCIGCWSCWWKTPGRCAFKDLDEFYHQYITADKAIYFSKVTKGFVSGDLKTIFDRMIPLYLPYTTHKTGESMHVPRYDKYPAIEFYYDGEFETDAGRQIFVDYINRVFYQFYSKNVTIKPVAEFMADGGNVA
jgi:hypothetical protein